MSIVSTVSMKIGVESTIFLQEHHLARLRKLGSISFYKGYGSRDEFIGKAGECDVLLVNKTFSNDDIPRLKAKLVSLWSTGYDVIDIGSCRKQGITVTNVPEYSTNSVAEQAFALMMELAKKTSFQMRILKEGKWTFDFKPLAELKGKTLGIIGFGNISRKVASIARAFDMNVLVHTRTQKGNGHPYYGFVDLDRLLGESDFITIHAPLNDSTRHMIGMAQLKKMKSTAFIINCSRGQIIDEKELIGALEQGIIAGAGLDVFEKEPLERTSKLLTLGTVVLTAHSAFYTDGALERLGTASINNIENFLAGKPTNVINP